LELAVQSCCIDAIEQELLESAHDVSNGGLAVALAECCIGGPDKPLGVRVETHEMIRTDALLFSESQSRIIVSLKETHLERLQELAEQHRVPLLVIGAVGGSRLALQPLLQLPVEELRGIWSNGLTARLK